MSNKAKEILVATLVSQLGIERARLKAYANQGNAAVYWMAQSTEAAVKEIERQLKALADG